MTKLSDFTAEERALIVSVPYRVGIWISSVDDHKKIKLDNKIERQALEGAISTLASRSGKMPFAVAVMRDLETHKSMWPAWESGVAETVILRDTQTAIALCNEKLPKGERVQYKQAVWQIGLMVAQAYGEQLDPDNEMHVNRFFAWMGTFMGKPALSKNPENMSIAEKTALKKLRAVLKG